MLRSVLLAIERRTEVGVTSNTAVRLENVDPHGRGLEFEWCDFSKSIRWFCASYYVKCTFGKLPHPLIDFPHVSHPKRQGSKSTDLIVKQLPPIQHHVTPRPAITMRVHHLDTDFNNATPWHTSPRHVTLCADTLVSSVSAVSSNCVASEDSSAEDNDLRFRARQQQLQYCHSSVCIAAEDKNACPKYDTVNWRLS